MKKVLFATTALVASAGMAAADIDLSGGGRIGLVYNDDAGDLNGDVRLERRMTINIDGSGETDGGLQFGGRIRIRSDEGTTNSVSYTGGILNGQTYNFNFGRTALSGSNIWIGTDTWRLTGGNTNGAVAHRVNLYGGWVGLTGNDFNHSLINIGENKWNVVEFSSRGNGGEVIRLDFTVGDFGASLSTTNNDAQIGGGNAGNNEIAVSYNFGDWTVGAGYEDDAAGNDYAVLTVDGSMGDFSMGIGYAQADNIGSKIRVYGGYNFGDTSVTVYIANADIDPTGTAITDDTIGGIGFTHSLGGAVLAGGIETAHDGNTHADLGIRFDF